MWNIVLNINDRVGIVEKSSNAHYGAIDKATHKLSDLGEYAVTLADVCIFMEDLGSFFGSRLAAKNDRHLYALL